MKDELKIAMDNVDEQMNKRAEVATHIAKIKSDAEKYQAQAAEIEVMEYTELTKEVLQKFSLLKTRLELIPKALERKEDQLLEIERCMPECIITCSRKLKGIVAVFADKKADEMSKALVALGTSSQEAQRTSADSHHIKKLRDLYFFDHYMATGNSSSYEKVILKLRPIVEEALKENPDFDRFVTV